MIKHLLCAAAVLAATPALAQDKPTFNGFYAGIQGGWQQDRLSATVSDDFETLNAGISQSGFAYGGQVGYDMRVGSGVVIGGEIALSGRTGAKNLDDIFEPVDPDFNVDVDPNNPVRFTQGLTVGVTGRVGYLFSETVLGYVRGGYTNTTYIIRDNDFSESTSRGGFQIGAGAEMMVASNISVRLEYAYSQYGTGDLLDGVAGELEDAGYDLTGIDASTKLSRNAILFGANFRF
jgi:outer membrane immunogenic protein